MRRFKTPFVAIGVSMTLVLGAIAAATVLTREPPNERRPTFEVRGNVHGLYPGIRRVLHARVVNRFDHMIAITRVSASVRSPRQGCPSDAVRVVPWRGRREIAPNRTRRVHLVVRMRRWAPEACQGVRFRLHYDGKAIRT